MSHRTLSQITLLTAVLLLFAGLQSFAAFTEPNTAPPNADAYAPLTTGPAAQGKTGGLVIGGGLSIGGNTGIGTTKAKGTLDVENSNKTATICLNGVCSKSLGGGALTSYNDLPTGALAGWCTVSGTNSGDCDAATVRAPAYCGSYSYYGVTYTNAVCACASGFTSERTGTFWGSGSTFPRWYTCIKN